VVTAALGGRPDAVHPPTGTRPIVATDPLPERGRAGPGQTRAMAPAETAPPKRHRNDHDVIRRLLSTPGRWAVVGLSENPARVAYGIARYLQSPLGMQIVPVHPSADSVHGEKGYPTLADIPGTVDVVDVFVRSELAGAVVDAAIAAGAGAVWLQLGVIDEAAAARATAAGLDVVMDTCPAIEAPRLGVV
jgi:predicted CoA-binding protein